MSALVSLLEVNDLGFVLDWTPAPGKEQAIELALELLSRLDEIEPEQYSMSAEHDLTRIVTRDRGEFIHHLAAFLTPMYRYYTFYVQLLPSEQTYTFQHLGEGPTGFGVTVDARRHCGDRILELYEEISGARWR